MRTPILILIAIVLCGCSTQRRMAKNASNLAQYSAAVQAIESGRFSLVFEARHEIDKNRIREVHDGAHLTVNRGQYEMNSGMDTKNRYTQPTITSGAVELHSESKRGQRGRKYTLTIFPEEYDGPFVGYKSSKSISYTLELSKGSDQCILKVPYKSEVIITRVVPL